MAQGYLSSVAYTSSFYRETAPAWLAFAALAAGRDAGAAARPQRVLELGFGQGFGLCLLAAANPDVAFEGCDFMPEHVAHAQGLIDEAQLANISVSAASFEGLARQDAPQDVDVIIAHGVLSWIPDAARQAVVEIVRRRLKPRGVFHISYNCSPGAVPDTPIRDVFRAVARRTGGGPDRQVAAALQLLARLRQGSARYFAANPVAAAHLDLILKADPVYLAHEYLGDDWRVFRFEEVAEMLAAVGLSYAGSAVLADNIAGCSAPLPLQPLLAQAPDPVWRETLADLAANRAFRRDIFIRGEEDAAGSPAAATTALADWTFGLTRPRAAFTLEFEGPLGRLAGAPGLYEPIADRLAQSPASLSDLSALPAFEARADLLPECLAFLVESGQVCAAPPRRSDPEPARRFNRVIAARSLQGRLYGHLAASATRSGLAVDQPGLLALAAMAHGAAEEPGAIAAWGLNVLKAGGRRVMQDGAALEDDQSATALLEAKLAVVLAEQAPVWRSLGVI